MTTKRILELAKQCFKNSVQVEFNEIEELYQLAYQDGQRAMMMTFFQGYEKAEMAWRMGGKKK